MDILYLVIPCYNEEEVLPETAARLFEKLEKLIAEEKVSPKSKILFVNDGSRDRTWEIICGLHEKNPLFSGLCLSRNRGHQNALLAGLMTAKELCDVSISLDADLQDDIDAIDGFLEKYSEGCDVVYGVRSSRKKDSFFKRTSAHGFYKLMEMMGVNMQKDHADYRLMSKRALAALSEFGEVNLFLRGIVPLIGFKSGVVYYERNERFAGKSKYPLRKMIAFALDGITSFSVKPIRLVTALGVVVFAVSLVMLVYFLVIKLTGNADSGWTSLVGSIWLLSGLQLLSLGIIGEYIGKIYSEAKGRPRYIIWELVDENDKEKNDHS